MELPPELQRVAAVVPLNGGCVATGAGAAGFWSGGEWNVAPDMRTLVERHGRRFTKMLPQRVFAADTSSFIAGTQAIDHRFLLASDGRGGLWLANDRFDVIAIHRHRMDSVS